MSQKSTVGAQEPVLLKPMRVMVRGHIEQIRSFDGMCYTRVITPAPDTYSRLQVVEMHAKQKLGEKGGGVAVVCSPSGYQHKPRRFRNRDTGEVETIIPVDHVPNVVEA